MRVIAIALASVALSSAAAELHKCTDVDRKTRYTRDQHDVRVGEQCRPLTPKEIAQRRAEAQRPPTPAEHAAMRSRANKMDFWQICIELGRVLRNPNTTPRGEAWERIVTEVTRVPPNEVGYIRDRRLRIGMGECIVVAILGKPDALNRTNTAAGRSDQLVYRSKRIYAYTENGILRSWQE